MAKGNHIMGNRKGTSDAVGGLSDPSVFMTAPPLRSR
jgi:hypothetical protein